MARGPLTQLPGSCPITWFVIGANALTFVVAFVGGGALWGALVFRTEAILEAPWTILSYPLVGAVGAGGILWILLGGYMMWLFGGSLERAWGAVDYVRFLVLVSAATAIGEWVGAILLGRSASLAGFAMPLAAATVAWAAINPSERLMLYFVLPIEARWLGLGAAVLVFFSFRFPLGVFALAGCAVAWWYVRTGRYLLSRGRARVRPRRIAPEQRATLNPLALYRRWRLKRQFMRLMRPERPDDREIH